MTTRAAAIIPAAGSGTRMLSSRPKQYLMLCGKPILVHTVEAFHLSGAVDRIVVAVPADRVSATTDMLVQWGLASGTEVIAGGVRRQDSVKLGLDRLDEAIDIVLVHDGARPLISTELIRRCRDEAAAHGAAIAAVPVKDTLKRGDGQGTIAATVDRRELWQAQTPQAARIELLRRGYAAAGERDVTDEASLLELAAIPVRLVTGSESNIKITRPEDLIIAEKMLMQQTPVQFKIGHGFDAHRFAADRDLVLAGVKIDHHMGLAGHSDADVVTHAVCDALLGALGRGDIGMHFPDTSAEFKDIYSIRLLERVYDTIQKDGFTVGNIDITIICQEPKLAPHIEQMKQVLSRSCRSEPSRINIKATTTERMGYTGRKEGIGAHAVALLFACDKEITTCR